MQNKNGYKRAFTLTELLVVVVVIGVLAALTLPKFSKVLETRKTTEAENILRAVRTEQERRCALDKNYLGDLNKMPDLVPNTTTANYTYAALTGGIRAQSNGSLNYQLQIPSYADGRICCTGADCSQLNKDYPTCDELRAKPDYVASPDECAADVGETPDPAQCGPQPADDQESCPSGFCGTRTRSYTCNPSTGQWIPGEWQGVCSTMPKPQTTNTPITCPNGAAGTETCITTGCPGNTDTSCTTTCPQCRWKFNGSIYAGHTAGPCSEEYDIPCPTYDGECTYSQAQAGSTRPVSELCGLSESDNTGGDWNQGSSTIEEGYWVCNGWSPKPYLCTCE